MRSWHGLHGGGQVRDDGAVGDDRTTCSHLDSMDGTSCFCMLLVWVDALLKTPSAPPAAPADILYLYIPHENQQEREEAENCEVLSHLRSSVL
ncbi:hypothetical protein KOW79_005182 [Hemibagrus wyckioides]|uniref:Uncharacterized protein n=1 Tax=Hemibagrus wyckioides TaxID=337641 RepID=A0A9D3P1H6_9TELE|nr:hypothetical protein KOW79_005182 [Hemibagrus wyckioides]